MRTSNLLFWLILSFLGAVTTGCQSKDDKVKGTIREYLYKNMKDPESLKILSCEIRNDTVPFYLTLELLNLADKYNEALNEFARYESRGYLWANEKYESAQKVADARQNFETAYRLAKANSSNDIETFAYVKASGNNPLGGVVSSSSIFIIDKDNPAQILGVFTVDKDLILQLAVIKTIGESYEFKANKFGKFETDGLTCFEQFILNDTN